MKYQICEVTRTAKSVQVKVELDKELSELLKDDPFAALGVLFFDFNVNASEALIVSGIRNWFIQAKILRRQRQMRRQEAATDLSHLNGKWFDL